jgi:transcriptional regulator with XRE-family HTH domain
LRTMRIKRNLTQVALAKRAGLVQNTISKLESTASARPPYATHTAIARALDIDPDRLRFGPDPNYRGPRNDLQRVRDRPLREPDAAPAGTTDDPTTTTRPAV